MSKGLKSKKNADSPYHHGDLRNAMINAGYEILLNEGASELTIRKAAKIVGVSQAAPYRHFQNKEALLGAIAQKSFVALADRIRDIMVDPYLESEILIQHIATTYLAAALENSDHFKVMFSAPTEHPAREFFDQLLKAVRRCQKAGNLRGGDPEPIALTLWSGIHGFTTLVISHRLDFLGQPQAKRDLALKSLVHSLCEGMQP